MRKYGLTVREQNQLLRKEQGKEYWFQTALRVHSPEGQRLLLEIERRVEDLETTLRLRTRKRSKVASSTWQAILSALTAGLIQVKVHCLQRGLALALGKPRSREKIAPGTARPFPAEMLRSAVDRMERAGLISIVTGEPGRLSTIIPITQFDELYIALGASAEGTMEDHRDLIALRLTKSFYNDRGRDIPFEDCSNTIELRNEVAILNHSLNSADLSVAEGCLRQTLGNRCLRRIFHRPANPQFAGPDFSQGGRLYGGWWQNMDRDERLRFVRIDGHPIAIIDWNAAWPRIAYAAEGLSPPTGDLYSRIPFPRDGVKKVMSALLGSTTPLTRFPKGTRSYFPANVTFAEVRDGIFEVHPPIAAVAGTGFYVRAMKDESDALLLALRRLKELGITALPIHDAVAVALPYADKTAEVMKAAFRDIVGVEGFSKCETGAR